MDNLFSRLTETMKLGINCNFIYFRCRDESNTESLHFLITFYRFTADDQAQLKVTLKVMHFCFLQISTIFPLIFRLTEDQLLNLPLKYLSPVQKEMRKCIQTARCQRNFKMARADDAEFAVKQ